MVFNRKWIGRKINKLLLIYPPVTFSQESMKQCHLPLGLAYLSAVAKEVCEVKVLDCAVEGYYREERVSDRFLRYGLSFEDIKKEIEKFKPDMVGVSCLFSSQFQNVKEVCKRTKEIDRDILTVIGGTHPSFLYNECLEEPAIDFVIRGEGEFSLKDLIECFEKKKDPIEVAGLAFRVDDTLKETAHRKPHQNLDEIPFPARELFPLEKYFKIGLPMGILYKKRPFMNMITSRGCPYRCTFCSSTNFWGNKYRTRSPENVLDEMEDLVNRFGIKEIKFFDDNLTADKERAKRIFKGMIERGIKLSWNTPNGIHIVNLDDEMLALMKESGCYELTLAIESGDQYVLKNIIHKPIELNDIERAVSKIKRAGLGCYGFFIIGFPGETKEQIQRTLDFSRKLDLDRISVFIANPLPGTALFELCKEMGYLKDDFKFDELDYFESRFETTHWKKRELLNLRRNWFWRYNISFFFRHPLRFLRRYKVFISRPRLVYEILKKRWC